MLFRHIASGAFYRKLFEVRHVPSNQTHIVYAQLASSVERVTGKPLRAGTLWTREKQDFNDKFQCISKPQATQRGRS